MLITTTENLPGYEIVHVIGLVQGNTVRARNVGRDMMAGLRNMVGGEISDYSRLMLDTRGEALERMVAMAEEQGADAVIGLRYETADIMQSAAEVFCYGTAVKLKRAG